jgi:uroporphyrinogen decarboxylase
MNSKERLQTAMQHEEPDRVPYMATFVPEVELLLKKRFTKELAAIGLDAKTKYQGVSALDILFDHDMLLLTYGISTGYYRDTPTETYVDEWGIKWKKIPYDSINGPGHYTEIVEFPLADEDKLDGYVPPDPDGEDMGYADAVIARYGEEKYINGIIDCSIFEALKYLRGITQSLIDLIQNKDVAHRIMDMSVDYHLKLGFKLIERGVDILWLADDIGGEHSMLMSPAVFREMIKPKMGYMIGELKKRNRAVKIAFHSDGYIEPVIDDLVDVGVDLLNPVQPESMDPARLKKRYGGRLALWGTVSTQSTLPFGSAAEVEREVRERIETCGPGGGFLIAPTHNIQLDVPFENIEAFYGAVKKYGAYPIRRRHKRR